MGSTWIGVVTILLGIMVSLNLGLYDLAANDPEYWAAQNATSEYYGNVTSITGGEQSENIIQNWLQPLLIGAATLGILTYFVPGASSYAIPAAFAATIISYFVQPINTLNALGLPWYVTDSVLLIFSLMFIIALIDFVKP